MLLEPPQSTSQPHHEASVSDPNGTSAAAGEPALRKNLAFLSLGPFSIQ